MSGQMTDYKLAIAIVGLELLWLFGGGLCLYIGIKKGFLDQRMERRGQVFAGPEAVRVCPQSNGTARIQIAATRWTAEGSRAEAQWSPRARLAQGAPAFRQDGRRACHPARSHSRLEPAQPPVLSDHRGGARHRSREVWLPRH